MAEELLFPPVSNNTAVINGWVCIIVSELETSKNDSKIDHEAHTYMYAYHSWYSCMLYGSGIDTRSLFTVTV